MKPVVLIVTALALLLVVMIPSTAPPAEAAGDCGATPLGLSDPNIATMWAQINAARAVFPNPPPPPLVWSDTLARSATWMAYDASHRVGNSDASYPSLIDSLGRDTRTRLTDCGYRTDANVSSSVLKVVTSSPGGAFSVWQGYSNLAFYRLIHDPSLRVAGLGMINAPWSFYPYWWAIDAGTLPDTGTAPTPVPPTATPVPPTQTPFPTAVPTPIKPRSHYINCMIDAGSWPGPIDFSCDE